MVGLLKRSGLVLTMTVGICWILVGQNPFELVVLLRSEHPEWLIDNDVSSSTLDSMLASLHGVESLDLLKLGYIHAIGNSDYEHGAAFVSTLASIHGGSDQPDEALLWLQRAKAEIPQDYAKEHAFIENELAITYNLKNELAKEIQHFNRSIEYWQAVDSMSHYQCYPLGNLSLTYFEQGLYKESLQLLRETMKYAQSLEGIDRLYNNVFDYSRQAALMQKLGILDSVRYYTSQSMAAAREIAEPDIVNAAKSWALATFLDMDSLDGARDFVLENPLEDLEEVSRPDIVDGYLIHLVRYYVRAGMPERAAPLVDVVAEPLSAQSRIIHFSALRDFYLATGEGEFAKMAVDSLWSAVDRKKQTDRQNNLALVSLEVEKKALEQDHKLNASKSRQQRVLILVLSVVLLVLALLAWIIWRASKQRKRILNTLSETHQSLKVKNEELEKYIQSNIQLEQFAHIAAHGLKSPLRTIASFNGLLKRQIQSKITDVERDYLGYIEKGSESMSDLIDDLLTYSKVNSQSLQMSEFILQGVVDEVLQPLQFQIDECNAKVVCEGLDRTIAGDRLKIRQVFQNLISNALKFVKEDEFPAVTISADQSDDELIVRVADNGIGIAPEFHDKIFRTFTKLHSLDQFEGTGIGLAICQEIVKKHGGRIWVESKLGIGSTFYFTLPYNSSFKSSLALEVVPAGSSPN